MCKCKSVCMIWRLQKTGEVCMYFFIRGWHCGIDWSNEDVGATFSPCEVLRKFVLSTLWMLLSSVFCCFRESGKVLCLFELLRLKQAWFYGGWINCILAGIRYSCKVQCAFLTSHFTSFFHFAIDFFFKLYMFCTFVRNSGKYHAVQ